MSPNQSHPGDDGSTGLLGEGRVRKNHPRIETLGTLDEASAALGLARSLTKSPQTGILLKEIQRDLYSLMAEVAATPDNIERFQTLDKARLEWLESQMEALKTQVTIPGEFILPGDTLPGAAISVARTIIRRAERRVVELTSQGEITNEVILSYLNRLSLVCFLLELYENQSSGQETNLAKN
jgi:cob(I)alamin adenosyltransferase